MSIEKRTCHCFQGLLGPSWKWQPSESRHIKVLQTLGCAAMQDAIDIKVLQTLSPERKRHGYRSAGACPPRSLRRNEKRPQPGSHGRLLSRSMHGEGQALLCRRDPANPDSGHDRCMARDRPSPYGGRRMF